jgi:type II restriction enzyme
VGRTAENFRSIRRGLQQVVAEIESGFGVAYRGSSLETVVHSIAEQRQIFKGADHAWLWKPKLRIPDIYESPDNQRAFGRLLDNCSCCDTAEEIISHIRSIDALKIKGLGRRRPTCSISFTRRWCRPSIPRSSRATMPSPAPR